VKPSGGKQLESGRSFWVLAGEVACCSAAWKLDSLGSPIWVAGLAGTSTSLLSGCCHSRLGTNNPLLVTWVEMHAPSSLWRWWVVQPLGITGGNLTAVEKPPGHRHFNVRENRCATGLFLGVFAAVQPWKLLSCQHVPDPSSRCSWFCDISCLVPADPS
jgi:hypothetical protein